MSTRIKILRDGNLLCVWQPGDRAKTILEQALSYDKIRTLHGYEKAVAGTAIETLPTECFYYRDGSLFTNYGYRQLISKLLLANGYEIVYSDVRPHPDPSVFAPCWDRLSDVVFRHGQRAVLEAMVANEYGRILCPTGWGKSFLIGLLGVLWPKAKIDITTKSADISRHLYSELQNFLPDVGLYGAGKRKRDSRVQIYCAGSLRHSPYDADVLIGDEVHELAAPSFISHLAAYRNSRNYGFSASHDQRLDNADFELLGLFGPIICRVSYDEAEKAHLIVPIQVRWRDVVTNSNPCQGLSDVPMRRRGIWQHRYRNEQIVADARSYDADSQVLITVETIEHAVYLKMLLPEFTLVYSDNGLKAEDRLDYIRRGLLPADHPIMTPERRYALRMAFEKGELKKVIATSVWNRGVNFCQLSVLIRADGGGSAINDTQIPGRVSRISEGKESSIVHDYRDQFDRRFLHRAQRRYANYQKHGWQQVSAVNPRRIMSHGINLPAMRRIPYGQKGW